MNVGDEIEFIDTGKAVPSGTKGIITAIVQAGIVWLPHDLARRSPSTTGCWQSSAAQLRATAQPKAEVAQPMQESHAPWSKRNADGRTPTDEAMFQDMLKRRAAKEALRK